MARRTFSTKRYLERLLSFNGRCAHCECKIGAATGLEWDHVIPVAMGGDDSLDNLQPLCKTCHRAKTSADVKAIAKAKRMEAKHLGIRPRKGRPMAGSVASGLRKKMNGTVETR